MIDRVTIRVKAGSGGNGSNSLFHRKDRKVVPDGGDGGKGGRIIFHAVKNAPPLKTLKYKKKFAAEAGGHGSRNKKRGRKGEDLVITVPEGCRIYDRGSELLIRERMELDEEVVVVEGGRGGRGNLGGKESTRGEEGKVVEVEISVSIRADVCLVGLPNSGKSSILNKLTRTQVPVVEYPFSTRDIKLGIFETPDFERKTLCELPSLIQGSNQGKGLGNSFLKYVEHAEMIFYVLPPISEFSASIKESLNTLKEELAAYSEDYLRIPAVVLLNKSDLEEAPKKDDEEIRNLGHDVLHVSTVTGDGIEEIRSLLCNSVSKNNS